MWTGLLWFALLTAAGLTYPRRPRVSGTLWITLGTLSLVMNILRNGGTGIGSVSGLFMIGIPRNAESRFGFVSGLFLIGMGTWYLIKYRNPEVRARHVEYWTAKA